MDQWPSRGHRSRRCRSRVSRSRRSGGSGRSPSGRTAPRRATSSHHANPGLIMPGEAVDPMEARSAFGQGVIDLIDSAVGTEGRVFPEGHGRVIRPGSLISWGSTITPTSTTSMPPSRSLPGSTPDDYEPEHYSMGDPSFRGTVITHVPFHPGSRTAHSPTGRFGDESDLLIPPHGVATIRGAHVLDRPAMIHSIRGHMHMRGSTRSSRPSIRTGAGRPSRS